MGTFSGWHSLSIPSFRTLIWKATGDFAFQPEISEGNGHFHDVLRGERIGDERLAAGKAKLKFLNAIPGRECQFRS